jgi:hypothetical protein
MTYNGGTKPRYSAEWYGFGRRREIERAGASEREYRLSPSAGDPWHKSKARRRMDVLRGIFGQRSPHLLPPEVRPEHSMRVCAARVAFTYRGAMEACGGGIRRLAIINRGRRGLV